MKGNHISQAKEFSTFLCMGRYKSWFTEINYDVHLTYLGLVSCDFTRPQVFLGLTIACSLKATIYRWWVFFSFLSFLRAHELTIHGGCDF